MGDWCWKCRTYCACNKFEVLACEHMTGVSLHIVPCVCVCVSKNKSYPLGSLLPTLKSTRSHGTAENSITGRFLNSRVALNKQLVMLVYVTDSTDFITCIHIVVYRTVRRSYCWRSWRVDMTVRMLSVFSPAFRGSSCWFVSSCMSCLSPAFISLCIMLYKVCDYQRVYVWKYCLKNRNVFLVCCINLHFGNKMTFGFLKECNHCQLICWGFIIRIFVHFLCRFSLINQIRLEMCCVWYVVHRLMRQRERIMRWKRWRMRMETVVWQQMAMMLSVARQIIVKSDTTSTFWHIRFFVCTTLWDWVRFSDPHHCRWSNCRVIEYVISLGTTILRSPQKLLPWHRNEPSHRIRFFVFNFWKNFKLMHLFSSLVVASHLEN